jgi:hypothetical protein
MNAELNGAPSWGCPSSNSAIRVFTRQKRRLTIRRDLTLEQAEKHVNSARASSLTDNSDLGRRIFEKNSPWTDHYEPQLDPEQTRQRFRELGLDV